MKTYFMFNNLFSENRTVYEIMSKNVVVTEKSQMTSQYGAYALRAGLARLYARMRLHTPTRLCTHMHARKHAHRDKYVILLFHSDNAFVNAPDCYVIRTLPLLFLLRPRQERGKQTSYIRKHTLP
jgi:hypothetical protein